MLERLTSLPSKLSGMFDQFSYGYLGFTLGPDRRTIYYLTGGPIYIDGKRVTGKATTAKGEAKGLEDLHLVTYDIPTAKYVDQGAIFMKDGQRPLYVNSIAVGKDGTVYTLCRIKSGDHTRTDLISVPATSVKLGNASPVTHLTNPLAIRIMNYGKYQDAAWTHLPSIGMHYLFLSHARAGRGGKHRETLGGSSSLPASAARRHRSGAGIERRRAGRPTRRVRADGRQVHVPVAKAHGREQGGGLRAVAPRRRYRPKARRDRRSGNPSRSGHQRPTVHLETMKAINHPNIRVNFDTGNITFYNHGADAVSELKKIIDYVATMELKDHCGQYKVWNFPVLGKGVVDFPGVLKVLETHGFRGPITMEVEGVQGVEMSEAQTRRYIAESVAYIQSLGHFK